MVTIKSPPKAFIFSTMAGADTGLKFIIINASFFICQLGKITMLLNREIKLMKL